jgi:hypothetical protein
MRGGGRGGSVLTALYSFYETVTFTDLQKESYHDLSDKINNNSLISGILTKKIET